MYACVYVHLTFPFCIFQVFFLRFLRRRTKSSNFLREEEREIKFLCWLDLQQRLPSFLLVFLSFSLLSSSVFFLFFVSASAAASFLGWLMKKRSHSHRCCLFLCCLRCLLRAPRMHARRHSIVDCMQWNMRDRDVCFATCWTCFSFLSFLLLLSSSPSSSSNTLFLFPSCTSLRDSCLFIDRRLSFFSSFSSSS